MTARGIAWQHMPDFIGDWPDETFEFWPTSYELTLPAISSAVGRFGSKGRSRRHGVYGTRRERVKQS